MITRFLILAVGAVVVAAGCTRAPEKLTPGLKTNDDGSLVIYVS